MSEQLIDPEEYVGVSGVAAPTDADDFLNEFRGTCIGTRNEFLQVQDQDGDVFEIETSQFTPDIG